VLDLFLNVEEFDRVRPRSSLYEGMRRAAHEMTGERYASPLVALSSDRRYRPGEEPDLLAGPPFAPAQRRTRRWIPRARSWNYVDHGTFTQQAEPESPPGRGRLPGGKRDGAWVWEWPDGSKREERVYKEGRLHGRVLTWYPNGQAEAEEHYRNGKPHARWRLWYPDGTPASEESYRDGLLDGALKQWHGNGAIAVEARYEAGTPVGTMTFWHPGGAKAEEGSFVEGQPAGPWTRWDEHGDVIEERGFETGESATGR